MSSIRWLETDVLSNLDISSAVAVGSLTAAADRMVLVQLFADQVAGSGNYTAYMTLQIGGVGSQYVMIPKTAATAAAGETALCLQSGFVAVRTGDVLTIYIDGLAGDTVTPDITVRFFDLDAVKPIVADRTLDVDSYGYVTVGTMDTGAIGDVADQVWDELLSGHVISGSAGHALGRIGSGQITTVSPVAQDGDVETYQGALYDADDGMALDWTDASNTWPELTGCTIAVHIGSLEFAGSVVVATGAGKKVRVELTETQSGTIPLGKHNFWVVASQADADVLPPLLTGKWTSKAWS